MKRLLLIVLPLLMNIGCYNDEELRKEINELHTKNDVLREEIDKVRHQYITLDDKNNPKGIYSYRIINDTLRDDGAFTGFGDWGSKTVTGYYNEGKKDKLWTWWHDGWSVKDRQKNEEGTYNNGKREGLWTTWYENGQKKEEGNYRIGTFTIDEENKKISNRTGQWNFWYDNGQKWKEQFHSSSSAYLDRNLGVEIDTWTSWYIKGQKKCEATFEKEENISSKCWDENGNELKCGSIYSYFSDYQKDRW